MNPGFWQKRKVLLTGHTGFKGSWLALWLQSLGAEVTGYSLAAPTEPSIFVLADVALGMCSVHGDVCDLEHLKRVVREHQPEIVFHLAAQSLVRRSYDDPVGTYATNIIKAAGALQAEAFLARALDEAGLWESRDALPAPVVTEFGALVSAAASPIDDVRGTAAYRRHALAVLARRTLGWAWADYQRLTDGEG